MPRPLADGLWEVPYTAASMGLRFPVRSTICRAADGTLTIISPADFDDETASAVEALGPVRRLVAPCGFHHLNTASAQARWPDATTWGVPALTRKRPDLRFDGLLPDVGDGDWDAALLPTLIEGVPGIDEVVFLHAPSRTLIVTDLVFAMRDVPHAPTRIVLKMAGAYGRVAQSRMWRFFTRDRAAAGHSVAAILASGGFDRLLMAHGEPVETEAPAALAEGCAWMLDAVERAVA